MTDRNDVDPGAGIQEPGGPGTANTPKGAPGERPAPSAAERAEPGTPLPGTNQGKNEPVPATPDRPSRESGTASADPQAASLGSSSLVREEMGTGPRPHDSETDNAAGAARMAAAAQGEGAGPAAPGDASSVPVPPERPAPGTSEASRAVEGVNVPHASADAQPGGAPTEAAQEGRALAHGKEAGTNPTAQAVVGRRSAPDGEVSPR